VFINDEANKLAFCGTTVDDCLFVCTNDESWINKQIQMLQLKYEEVMIEQGDELGLIGMQARMDRIQRKVVITQPKQVAKIIDAFQVTKRSPNPALVKLMGDNDKSPILKDQADYMSKCAMLMFISKRTYLELRPAVVKLSKNITKQLN
jgi:hypothetical protein